MYNEEFVTFGEDDVYDQTDAEGFARALQQGGYATDPAYADKLTRIIGGATLRNALAGMG